MNSKVDKIEIKGKDIYIFEKHHYALYPWIKLRREKNLPMSLLTLDHHTDTRSPFNQASLDLTTHTKNYEIPIKFLSEINPNDENSLDNVIGSLKNDEHIKTAIAKNIIKKAFIISFNDESDIYQDMLKEGENSIYVASNSESKKLYNGQFDDYVLQEDFLKEKFIQFRNIDSSVIDNDGFKTCYILDIDLDYFHTFKAINKSSNLFDKLIRDAEIITIATEPKYVDTCKLDKELDSKYLLEKMKEIIFKALDI